MFVVFQQSDGSNHSQVLSGMSISRYNGKKTIAPVLSDADRMHYEPLNMTGLHV